MADKGIPAIFRQRTDQNWPGDMTYAMFRIAFMPCTKVVPSGAQTDQSKLVAGVVAVAGM